MKNVLVLAAAAQAATGLVLLLLPSVAGPMRLGAELTGTAAIAARVADIARIALSVACWPGTPLLGMLGYSAAITLYFACLGFTGAASGDLLWPPVAPHQILTAILIRAIRAQPR